MKLLRREIGNQSAHESRSLLLQHAGGFTIRTAVNGAARRIRCVTGNACRTQRRAVGDGVVTHGVGQQDWIVRRYRIEVLRVDVAMLRELALVPAAASDELALLDALDAFPVPGAARR
ncbi:MAG: hypothetical protein WDO68_26320 [Gammaproteobacteria bacterium]